MSDPSKPYGIEDLLYLMERLREPETGCPWDLKQDYRSITPSTIEEAYEVVDAIERGELDHLKEELGDLLFQVIFYTQLSKEENRYDFHDVVHSLTAKLVRRHPHVFPEGTLNSFRQLGDGADEAKIKASWEAIKQSERADKGQAGLLDDIPQAFPALTRAVKLQKRAAKVGFDWDNPFDVLEKLEEEIAELKEVMQAREDDEKPGRLEEELGDVLFGAVNLARHLGVEPESSLRRANNKFEHRFQHIERSLQNRGKSLDEASVDEMEVFWNEAKASEKQ